MEVAKYKILLVESAEADIEEAFAWYRHFSEQIPIRFLGQIQSTLESISEFPHTHAVRYQNVRLANLRNFPYAIHYLIESEVVVVLSLHHTAKDR